MTRAICFDRYGDPDVLTVRDRPDPQAGPGEVLVRVAAAPINPTDLMMRTGGQARLMEHLSPPFVAGMEFAGRVENAGEGARIARGTPVIGVVNPRRPAGGAHAQLVAVPAASVAAIPGDIDLAGASTVTMNALTALLALELLRAEPGQTVLVTGGTGMLGSSAIRLATAGGLKVIACGRDSDAEVLRAMGAQAVVPRGEGLVAAVRSIVPDGVDGMIDGALIGAGISQAVADGGTAVSLRMSHPIEDARLNTTYVSVIDGLERQDLLTRIAGLLADGTLPPRVTEVMPFAEAAEAHRRAEANTARGRIVLDFSL